MVIPIGNHVLLCDHPEGCNKIQNRFESDVYVVVGHHEEPNVYYIKLLSADKDTKPKVVNRRQLFDLNQSVPPSVGRNSVDDLTTVPLFLHTNRKSNLGSSSNVEHNLDLDTSINLTVPRALQHLITTQGLDRRQLLWLDLWQRK